MTLQIKLKKEKGNYCRTRSVLNNVKLLFKKRKKLIEQFAKNNIISKDEKFYDTPKKSEESISEKLEQKSD